MTLSHWLIRLQSLHPKAIDLGLDRVATVAQELSLLDNNPAIFTVAGTNGKGSTTAIIREMLLANHYRVGVYTSPHLIEFNERIAINGQACDDELIAQALSAVDLARGGTSLTYFEFTTLAAIWIFKQAKLDVWVLEVGMGGRLDAVNVWNPDVAVVTSIDLDHQQWLGPDRVTIGSEKVAIGRRDKPLIIGEPDLPKECLQKARATEAKVYCIGDQFSWERCKEGYLISVETDGRKMVLGPVNHEYFHPNNIAASLMALVSSPLAIEFSELASVLANTQLLGRQTLISHSPDTLLDVGHNPHAARWLKNRIENAKYNKVYCVIGMLIDKSIKQTVTELLPVVDYWYPATLPVERGCSGVRIAEILEEKGAQVRGKPSESPSNAYKLLLSSVDKHDLIIIFGSFYTVSDILTHI